MRYRSKLNSKTPQWFKDWYNKDFIPVKVRQDIIIVLLIGTLAAVIGRIVAG